MLLTGQLQAIYHVPIMITIVQTQGLRCGALYRYYDVAVHLSMLWD